MLRSTTAEKIEMDGIKIMQLFMLASELNQLKLAGREKAGSYEEMQAFLLPTNLFGSSRGSVASCVSFDIS
jgi:hypothetical protein